MSDELRLTWQQLIDLQRHLKGLVAQVDRLIVEKQLTRYDDCAREVKRT